MAVVILGLLLPVSAGTAVGTGSVATVALWDTFEGSVQNTANYAIPTATSP